MKKIILFLTAVLFFLSGHTFAQTPSIQNSYQKAAGLPHLRIERSMIYTPGNSWLYNHHPAIIHFKDKFVAIWSNGLVDEDSPGQRVVYSTSVDFIHWSVAKPLASPQKVNDTLTVLTAAGLYQYQGTLVAYFGEYTKHRENTHLCAPAKSPDPPNNTSR